MMSELALLGGDRTISDDPGDLFTWPIITKDDEDAVLEVLRGGGMSGTDITKEFETQFAAWQEREYALGFSSGTGSLQTAMFACGVGVGDEIISPSLTYWATALPVFSLCGWTPPTAQNTPTAPSSTRNERSTSTVKST